MVIASKRHLVPPSTWKRVAGIGSGVASAPGPVMLSVLPSPATHANLTLLKAGGRVFFFAPSATQSEFRRTSVSDTFSAKKQCFQAFWGVQPVFPPGFGIKTLSETLFSPAFKREMGCGTRYCMGRGCFGVHIHGHAPYRVESHFLSRRAQSLHFQCDAISCHFHLWIFFFLSDGKDSDPTGNKQQGTAGESLGQRHVVTSVALSVSEF